MLRGTAASCDEGMRDPRWRERAVQSDLADVFELDDASDFLESDFLESDFFESDDELSDFADDSELELDEPESLDDDDDEELEPLRLSFL